MTGIADGRPATAHLSLGGVRMDAVDGLRPKELLRPLLAAPSCQHIITANVEYLRRAADDERLHEVLASAALVVPDGMPVVWAAKVSGARVSRRVTGHDLTHALAALSATEGASLFLLGAAPGVADGAAEALRARYPGVRIAGTYSPPDAPFPFPEADDRRMIETVNSSGAKALLVALGCPKQDLWLAAHRDDLKPSVAIGVGGVFDVLAGTRRRAPAWVQATGMEWTYRMLQEPRRLLPRYVKDAVFISKLFARAAVSRLLGSGEARRASGPR